MVEKTDLWKRVFAVLLYISTGLACAVFFSPLASRWTGRDPWPIDVIQFCAGFATPAVLLAGAILVLWKPRFASLAGLIGTGLAWPYFYRTEVWQYHFANSWVMMNLPPPEQTYGELRILAISLLVLATGCSLLGLASKSWHIGEARLNDRIWPAFCIWFLCICVWYFSAVSPYRVPIYDLYSDPPFFYIVHVNKHGLYFHETVEIIEKDGRFYVFHDDRRLFQYSFHETDASGDLPEHDEIALKAVVRSANLGRPNGPRNVSPWTWNADRWFVYSERDPKWRLLDVDGSKVPKVMFDFFQELPSIPKEEAWQSTMRDVCLGFCFFQGPPAVTH